MRAFSDPPVFKALSGSYLFFDSAFVIALLQDEEFMASFFEKAQGCDFYIDTFVEFELLRGAYASQLLTRKEFLSKWTDRVILHPELMTALIDNALVLSRIYAHQKSNGENASKSASFVDLFLAAQLMKHAGRSYLITPNKKDFPSCIFDVDGTIVYVPEGGSPTTHFVLSFNKAKFDECYADLAKADGTAAS